MPAVPVLRRSSAARRAAARRCRRCCDPRIGRPWKNRCRRKTGCAARSVGDRAVNSVSTSLSRASSQSTQLDLVVLAVDVVVAAAGCGRARRRARSSARPGDSSSVARKLRFCRSRSAWISPSSVGPSTPWFHDRLWLSPSRLSSPLASLCLSLYETRSCRVNPSCAVTKLIDAMRPAVVGLVQVDAAGEPRRELAQARPARRARSRARCRGSLPFHSVHSGGNPPTW